jgi:hypothetical protein
MPAKKKAKEIETARVTAPAEVVAPKPIRLDPIRVRKGQVTIRSREGSIMVQHKWDTKMMDKIREKKVEGRKTKERAPCDPDRECEAATYRLKDGRYALPVVQVKNAMISAAHRDIGFDKTLVRKGIFFVGEEGIFVPLITAGAKMREDPVRVPAKTGNADLRYRPMYETWSARLRFEYDAAILTIDDIVSLLDRAGFGIGVGEWRPEKNGDWGRFEVIPTSILDGMWK